jgi:hypothetical protein
MPPLREVHKRRRLVPSACFLVHLDTACRVSPQHPLVKARTPRAARLQVMCLDQGVAWHGAGGPESCSSTT